LNKGDTLIPLNDALKVFFKEALQSEFLKRLREDPEISKYTGGGCALWKNREQVRSLLDTE